MLTTLDTTRLVPRQQRNGNYAPNPAASPHEGPVFTIPEIMDILEDRPEIRELFRQSLVEFIRKEEEKQNHAPHQA